MTADKEIPPPKKTPIWENPAIGKAVLTVLISLIALGHAYRPKMFDEFFTVLLLVALSPWMVPFFSQYLGSVEMFGAKVEFQQLKQEVRDNSHRLDQLYLLSMSDNVFLYLKKLDQSGGFGSFLVGPAMPRELAHLENLGYIRFKHPLKGSDDFVKAYKGKPDGGNLSNYIDLTPTGKEFLQLRLASEKKVQVPTNASDTALVTE